MKRGLILYRIDTRDLNNSGVIHKMLGQQRAMNQLGFEVDAIWPNGSTQRLPKDIQKRLERCSGSILSKMKFWEVLTNYLDFKKYKFLWIRHEPSHPMMIRFLKEAKRQNPQIRTYLDVPTYPYRAEWSGRYGMLVMMADKVFKQNLHKYVDKVIHSGAEKKLWNIPVYYCTNGIDADQLEIRTPKSLISPIRMLAVGKWQYWHGLDRLINGLINYCRTRKEPDVYIHIVGEGPEIGRLKDLTSSDSIKKHVLFEGPLSRENLGSLYNDCHVGIGTLGIHRKGKLNNCSLKHREYCAKGLPFVMSGTDPDFPEDVNFVHHLPENNNGIIIADLIEFVQSTRKLDVSAIRGFAIDRLQWKTKLEGLFKTEFS